MDFCSTDQQARSHLRGRAGGRVGGTNGLNTELRQAKCYSDYPTNSVDSKALNGSLLTGKNSEKNIVPFDCYINL